MLQIVNRLLKRPYTTRHQEPKWRVVLADDVNGELCEPELRRFVINPTPTPERAKLHALAHLYLLHHEADTDEFSEQDCRDADDMTRLWLDEFSASSFGALPDGPPTLYDIAG